MQSALFVSGKGTFLICYFFGLQGGIVWECGRKMKFKLYT